MENKLNKQKSTMCFLKKIMQFAKKLILLSIPNRIPRNTRERKMLKKSENTYEFFFLWNGPHVSALLLPISLKFFLPQSFSYITFFSGVFTKCRVELLWLWHKCKSIFPRGSSITARYDGSKMKLSLSHFDNKEFVLFKGFLKIFFNNFQ